MAKMAKTDLGGLPLLISGETDKRPILLSGLQCQRESRRSEVRIWDQGTAQDSILGH